MQKLFDIAQFAERQNIVLEGFDPISAGGFTQVPNYLLNTKGLSAMAKVAYAKLLSYAWSNNKVFPGQERMAEELGVGVSTISEAITELKKTGWVDVERRGQGKTNVYTLKYVIPQHTSQK